MTTPPINPNDQAYPVSDHSEMQNKGASGFTKLEVLAKDFTIAYINKGISPSSAALQGLNAAKAFIKVYNIASKED